ncbi:unnamed protein product [Arabis nemorensis]|uniref:LsmAD domain-containing protein n=1 Tax=Arabis nemorensis TaxID=586526 RepID=A0A565BFX9_9BRAS|nr:unnamed protein product [Arabis nemorensis]
MACLIREGSSQGMKFRSPLFSKPPSKMLIIPADELVQVIAKDLPVYNNNVSNSVQSEKPLELLTDSSISQSYHVDLERELKPWVPDDDLPDCSDLENVFDDPWKRGWNQFEVNKTLFGVTSTFDEELYTTKLERGPRTRELEEHALRIAREIEGENTRDLHVAEWFMHAIFLHRKEAFSLVGSLILTRKPNTHRSVRCNNLTFGNSSASDGMNSASTGKFYEESNVLTQRSEESASGLEDIHEDAATSKLRACERKSSTDGKLVGPFSERAKSESSYAWPGSSISRNSESSAASPASNRPILSPSSSIGSLSSEKSTLNPNAKEFKLNPNAKSFKPSPTATQPQSPVADGSFYYPPAQHFPAIHVGYGMGATFSGQQQQPMMYNNTTQLGPNQTYYSPNGPQYPQQMMPRPVLFMPPSPYQPEMPYKGRDSY